ncbi:MAG: hypothetical protein WAS27_02435 [Candidatus Saccharimonadales bacterium]
MIISSTNYRGSYDGAWAFQLRYRERWALYMHQWLRPERQFFGTGLLVVAALCYAGLAWLLYSIQLGRYVWLPLVLLCMVFVRIHGLPQRIQRRIDTATHEGRLVPATTVACRLFIAPLGTVNRQQSSEAIDAVMLQYGAFQVTYSNDPYWWCQSHGRGDWVRLRNEFLTLTLDDNIDKRFAEAERELRYEKIAALETRQRRLTELTAAVYREQGRYLPQLVDRCE